MYEEEIWLNLNCHSKRVNAFALFLVYLSTNFLTNFFMDILLIIVGSITCVKKLSVDLVASNICCEY